MLKTLSTPTKRSYATLDTIDTPTKPKRAKSTSASYPEIRSIQSPKNLQKFIQRTSESLQSKSFIALSQAIFERPADNAPLTLPSIKDYYPIDMPPLFLNELSHILPKTDLFSTYELEFFGTLPASEEQNPTPIAGIMLLLSQQLGSYFCIPNTDPPGFTVQTDCTALLNILKGEGVTMFTVSEIDTLKNSNPSIAQPIPASLTINSKKEFARHVKNFGPKLRSLIRYFDATDSQDSLDSTILVAKASIASQDVWSQAFSNLYIQSNSTFNQMLLRFIPYLAAHSVPNINILGTHTLNCLIHEYTPQSIAKNLCLEAERSGSGLLEVFISTQHIRYASSSDPSLRELFSHLLGYMTGSSSQNLHKHAKHTLRSLFHSNDPTIHRTILRTMQTHVKAIHLLLEFAKHNDIHVRDTVGYILGSLLKEQPQAYTISFDCLAMSANTNQQDSAARAMICYATLMSQGFQYYTPLAQRYHFPINNIYAKRVLERYVTLLDEIVFPNEALQFNHKLAVETLKGILNPSYLYHHDRDRSNTVSSDSISLSEFAHFWNNTTDDTQSEASAC